MNKHIKSIVGWSETILLIVISVPYVLVLIVWWVVTMAVSLFILSGALISISIVKLFDKGTKHD